MEYEEYDLYISKSGIFSDIYKKLDDIEKELSDLKINEIDSEIKRLLEWEGQLLICCDIPLEHRKADQQFLFPHIVYTNGIRIPDIDSFVDERFEFYAYRIEKVMNINVKLRYANFCYQYCEKKQKFSYAKLVCSLLCDFLDNTEIGYEYIVGFSRLSELCLSYSIKGIIQKFDGIIDKIISCRYNSEKYLDLLSLSCIVTKNILINRKNMIQENTKKKFADLIKEITDSYFLFGSYQLFRCYSSNLIDWFKILRMQEEIDKIQIRIGESFELDAEKEENTNLIKAEFYQMAAEHYANIGNREKVYHLKVKIKNSIREATKADEFKTISSTQTVSVNQLENETKEFFKDSIDETLNNISHSSNFFINKDKIIERAVKQSQNPLCAYVDFGRIDGNRKTSTTRNYDDTIKYFTYFNYGIELEVKFSITMNFIWDKMRNNGLTAQMVVKRICDSEYMNEAAQKIVKIGIERFFEDDYISTLHILVPQFENYIRTLFEWGGYPTTSLKNRGLQHEQNFNEFLLQDYVKETLEEDFLFMIEYVMIEQQGKNLRNNIAHGLTDIREFNKSNCLIVVYLFWMITCIKWR